MKVPGRDLYQIVNSLRRVHLSRVICPDSPIAEEAKIDKSVLALFTRPSSCCWGLHRVKVRGYWEDNRTLTVYRPMFRT